MRNALRLALVATVAAALVIPETSSAQRAELPLIPTRTVKFTTDEGTWMSLDVSPDGQTIVFDLVGRPLHAPIAGGKATRITSGMGFDGQPRFSPDGKTDRLRQRPQRLREIWLVDADGRNPRRSRRTGRRSTSPPPARPTASTSSSRATAGHPRQHVRPVDDHKDGGTGVKLTGNGTAGGAARRRAPARRQQQLRRRRVRHGLAVHVRGVAKRGALQVQPDAH